MDKGTLISCMEWLGSFLALGGMYVMSRHKKEGFLLLLGYNVAFLLMSLYTKQWGLFTLMIVFMGLNTAGYINWCLKGSKQKIS